MERPPAFETKEPALCEGQTRLEEAIRFIEQIHRLLLEAVERLDGVSEMEELRRTTIATARHIEENLIPKIERLKD